MLEDLTKADIQPYTFDPEQVPNIRISNLLSSELEQMFQDEGVGFVTVSRETGIVQTDKDYILFSNQWLYLAVLCKKYAEALIKYGEFFDTHIRSDARLVQIVINGNYDDSFWKSAIPDDEDREKIELYIKSGNVYKEDGNLINEEKLHSAKEIFSSLILKKLPVPKYSYLGTIIYYLAKRPDLYNRIENEVKNSIKINKGIRLPNNVRDCAKKIVDCIYQIDSFENINDLFVETNSGVKIDTNKVNNLFPKGNFLRYMFSKPTSGLLEDANTRRLYVDSKYHINLNNHDIECYLTTQWVNSDILENGNGNYLKALIQIVNKYYADKIEIKTELGNKYLYYLNDRFKISNLPNAFQTDFSKRYIKSLLAKPFVILTGNSGTGKTRISKQFAEYLEVELNGGGKNWVLVPVGADWTDNTKILGYYNPLANDGKGAYEETSILRLLEKANRIENKDIPFFIILDEMNLSHVERYFADFLSHMETPDLVFNLDGYEKEPVRFTDNIFIVGTVNIDETTYMFSPKVLDRANVIEFKPEKKSVMQLFQNQGDVDKITPAKDGSAQAFCKLSRNLRNGLCNVDGEKLDKVQETFNQIYDIVEKSGYEFAYRTVNEIRQYIAASYEVDDQVEIDNIIDEQLIQKVLPKIHGNKKEIGKLLEELNSFCEKNNLKRLSQSKIEQMKGKLVQTQYASFI